MKKTANANDFNQYLTQMYGGMIAGMIFLAAIASCVGLVGNVVELGCVLMMSVTSSAFCIFASQYK